MNQRQENTTHIIQLAEVIGLPFCVSQDDGNAIFSSIEAALDTGDRVQVSFRNVETVISAFLNAAIGQLYGRYTREFIAQHISYTETTPEIDEMIENVVTAAIDFFKSPKNATAAQDMAFD